MVGLTLVFAGLACSRGDEVLNSSAYAASADTPTPTQSPTPTLTITPVPTAIPPTATLPVIAIQVSPTPDQVREPPEFRDYYETHIVRYGDTLNAIAQEYGVGVLQIQAENGIGDLNVLTIGRVLNIPPPTPESPGPSSKLIPDSELVYGPSVVDLEPVANIVFPGSVLATYSEEVDETLKSGPAIVQMVAEDFSINPRLLLAILEFQSGWVRGGQGLDNVEYPIGYYSQGHEGLLSQLYWVAEQLNAGFYRWKAGWAGPYVFTDGRVLPPGAGVNAGTVAVQYLFSQLYPVEEWRWVVGDSGFYQTYNSLFGNPFQYAVDPITGPDLSQPELSLPFENGRVWSYTGGPHSAYGNWAAWAALDFAPPGYALGCVNSNEWITAVADGIVVRSDRGQVVQDLGEDGFEQTGWVVLYLHVDSRDRVATGTMLKKGDPIGHPSCEGGYSTGTHVHLARKYNGVWISADGEVPFNLEGWISSSDGVPYEGSMTRNGVTLLACSCRESYNQISR